MPTRSRNWRARPTDPGLVALFDQLGRRWALRVVWELRGGALTFRGLQRACGHISPSVLQSRLHELGRQGIIEKVPRLGYRLSARGDVLYQALEGLAEWARRPDGDRHFNDNQR